ncbi:exodeoxyribonuclease X C-terminal domain-containing protein [Flavobacterium wongokense]|uniref:exodeoxyribonuclease X C-terminal domain-containing protein n=1 Tax=Flavobacterium wongokense TaxID=2910674 RepID=UPI001F2E1C6E|nr:hypothetical protein [Flavobacterium sp. WG47]MCF6133448.1 hypothetical protein [Flavobacterium sp. WG47]
MKFYYLDTIFNFGKYEGKTLKDVASEDIMYIEWCIMTVESFVMDKLTVDEIKKINAGFLSIEGPSEALEDKIEEYNNEQMWQQQREEDRQSNDYGSNWNNEHYDDGLDLDQQSPEWWDSL